MNKYLFAFILIGTTSHSLFAQELKCAQTLRLARSTFESGRLHELPALLENCLRGGFELSEKVEAYKLLTQAYIYLEEPEKADETMLKLLQTDHFFQVNEAVDPAEFIALYRTFRTKPIYRIGGKAGAIATQPSASGNQGANPGEGTYSRGYGFTGGISYEIPWKPRFTLNPELFFSIQAFKFKNLNSLPEGDFLTNSTTSTNYISFPLLVQYDLLKKEGNLRPYVSAGISPNYLFAATKTPERKLTNNQPIESKSFDVVNEFEKFDLSILASAGIKYRFGGGFLVAEVRYRYGLLNVNTAASTAINTEITWDYHYLDGLFKLNSLQITGGYIHNIFNPKKLNK
jgi:Outer membrane protein beta-barrel domain